MLDRFGRFILRVPYVEEALASVILSLCFIAILTISSCALTIGGESWFHVSFAESTRTTRFVEGETDFSRVTTVTAFSSMDAEEDDMGYGWADSGASGTITIGSSASGIDNTGQTAGVAAIADLAASAGLTVLAPTARVPGTRGATMASRFIIPPPPTFEAPPAWATQLQFDFADLLESLNSMLAISTETEIR